MFRFSLDRPQMKSREAYGRKICAIRPGERTALDTGKAQGQQTDQIFACMLPRCEKHLVRNSIITKINLSKAFVWFSVTKLVPCHMTQCRDVVHAFLLSLARPEPKCGWATNISKVTAKYESKRRNQKKKHTKTYLYSI